MPGQVIELPSKVTVGISKFDFVVIFGYSQKKLFFKTFVEVVDAITEYFIKRKVTSCLSDLKAVTDATKSVKEEVLKELTPAVLERLDTLAKENENLKVVLKKEHYYRTKLEKMAGSIHAEAQDQAVSEALK